MTDTRDAFELLSKPTLELTEADRKAIFEDLRARRMRFLAGKADKPVRKPAAPKVEESPEAKQARTQNLLGDIGNLF